MFWAAVHLQVYQDFAAAGRNRSDMQMVANTLMTARWVAVPLGLIIGFYTLCYTAGKEGRHRQRYWICLQLLG